MLKKINIINFRSIENKEIYFENKNAIIWENWAWKTNILQAISFLFLNNNFWYKENDILKTWSDYIYINWIFEENDIENNISFSYDKNQNKKVFILNNKKLSKKQIFDKILKISYFSPIFMNLFYLWPKLRREFLDNILLNIHSDYELVLKNYEKIVKNRNKLLKNIYEWKSKKEEISFWNNEFVKYAIKIYNYKIPLNNFLEKNIKLQKDIFVDKDLSLSYKYISKVDLSDIENSIKNYLEKNIDRDIILWKTHIWPHIDDFNIFIEDKEIINFASRWELKSIILSLKLIEINYIQNQTNKKPTLLIDDLWSELDEKHINLIFEKLEKLQIIFTSINYIESQKVNTISI